MDGIYSKSFFFVRREIKNEQHLLIYKSCPILSLYWWRRYYLPKESFITNKLWNFKAYRDEKVFLFTKRLTTHCIYIVSAAPLHNTALDVQHLCIYQVPVPAMGCSAGKAFWLPEVILGCDLAAMSM